MGSLSEVPWVLPSCRGRGCEHGLGVLVGPLCQHGAPGGHSVDREPSPKCSLQYRHPPLMLTFPSGIALLLRC